MTAALIELCFGGIPNPDDALLWQGRDDDSSTERQHPTSNDAEQLTRLHAGDTAVFDALMLEQFNPLVRFAASIVRDHAVAEDVVQDVFANVWAQRETLHTTSLTAYLYRAVRNRALNVTKQTVRRARLSQPLRAVMIDMDATGGAGAGSDSEPAEDDPRVVAIRRALETLPERRQTVLRLRYDQELSYPEIAAILGISLNAAQQLVFHAIRALRAAINS